MFDGYFGDTDIQAKDLCEAGEMVITAGLGDLGIAGKTTRVAKIFPKNSLTLDMFGNCFFRNFDYKLVTHARVFAMIPKFEISEKIGLFLQTQFFCYPKFFDYNNMCSWNKVKDKKIELPTTASGDIDFEFMEARIRALDAYLEACGFENGQLSDSEGGRD